MTHIRQQEEALFDAARRLPGARARQAFLDQACADKPALRARLDALLVADVEAERFFDEAAPFPTKPAAFPESSLAGTDAATTALPLTEGPGSRIGRYKLLQRIGEGGCGVVYMAEQEHPVRRRVALKIIKLGMDTKNVIARFEAERQALAMMDHPNIARVLDAGATATGRPYFVMELVRGVRITGYCDQNHLDTRRRLELFMQICHAIQHAHQKGIIHRDIKPSNILVTLHDGVPVPKVIDFGIAKATEARLTDKTLFTAYEQFIGTPAYMSPEQAEMSGLDVDTRSDIYSLGVLLYELLTGKTPFDAAKLVEAGLDEMRRTLREREPQRPSTMVTTLQGEELRTTAKQRHAEPPRLISLLRGDLDWIVMKALEKDRSRRYETSNGLAMDIQRHLDGEPVLARPPSRIYQFQKLVGRNKVLFLAAGITTMALAISASVSTRLFLGERDARQQADHMRQAAEQARAKEAELRKQAEAREKITQAAVLLAQEEFGEADRVIGEWPLAVPTLEGAAVFRTLGEWHAVRAEWGKAAERFRVLLQVNQLDGWDILTLDYLACGSVLVELGDRQGYERFRENALIRFAGTSSPVTAERIVKISVLGPAPADVMQSLVPLGEFAAKSFFHQDAPTDVEGTRRAGWAAVSLALLDYRFGNGTQALAWCRRALETQEPNPARDATAHVIAAMAWHRLGHADKARKELAEGALMVDMNFSKPMDAGSGALGFWFDWISARILLREAQALIESRSRGDRVD